MNKPSHVITISNPPTAGATVRVTSLGGVDLSEPVEIPQGATLRVIDNGRYLTLERLVGDHWNATAQATKPGAALTMTLPEPK